MLHAFLWILKSGEAFIALGSWEDLEKPYFQVVKVGDFGVARVKAQTGVMTAETGTYRWMAPEVYAILFQNRILETFNYLLYIEFFELTDCLVCLVLSSGVISLLLLNIL